MQNICFPEGLKYDEENDAFITHNMNVALDLTKKNIGLLIGIKKKSSLISLSFSTQ